MTCLGQSGLTLVPCTGKGGVEQGKWASRLPPVICLMPQTVMSILVQQFSHQTDS